MMTIQPAPLLRQALLSDAVTTTACGLLMLIGASLLDDVLGLPQALLSGAGAILIPFALFVGSMGMKERIPTPVVWAIVIVNGIWAIDSILLLLSGWVSPSRAGYAFVIVQAAVVAMYAELQYMGLRRSKTALA